MPQLCHRACHTCGMPNPKAIQALLIEGEGRNAERKVVFGALATVTFDEATSSYRFPAHSDGKFLDMERIDFPELLEWIGEGRPYHDAPRQGEWLETTESVFNKTPTRPSVEMRLHEDPLTGILFALLSS